MKSIIIMKHRRRDRDIAFLQAPTPRVANLPATYIFRTGCPLEKLEIALARMGVSANSARTSPASSGMLKSTKEPSSKRYDMSASDASYEEQMNVRSESL